MRHMRHAYTWKKRSLCAELEYPVLQAALNDVGMVAEGLKETNVMSRQVKEGFPTPFQILIFASLKWEAMGSKVVIHIRV